MTAARGSRRADRRGRNRVFAGLGFAVVVCLALAVPAGAAPAAPSRAEALQQLRVVRVSIDRTLALVKEGQAEEAFAEAKSGYLSHFELVELPLRVVAPSLTADAETKFAEIRGLISAGAPVGQVRARIVELRGLVDEAERHLTDTGVGAPAVVTGQSFVIIFRDGLEAVLILSALLSYLEAAKAGHYRRPVLYGMGLAVLASAVTLVAMRALLDVLPVGREVLEAVTAVVAVAVLFYVSFGLIARLEERRWLEFLRTRVFTAVSAGSTVALVLVGFTAVYREGFETALFYQALLSFGPGLAVWVALGLALGVVALGAASYAIFRLGRRLPVKTFLSAAVVVLMVTSVTFLGNAVRSLQEADVVTLTPLAGWPRAPIFVSQALGYWPSVQTVVAQGGLSAVYLATALWVFAVQPRRRRRSAQPPTSAPGGTPVRTSGAMRSGS
jgi:high-affinity iron transporter